MNAYMLDTNLFNDVLDGRISSASFAGARLLAIGVQVAELRATKNAERRARLIEVFETISPNVVPAASFAFDIEGAGWDQACWNDGSGRFEKMLDRLQSMDAKGKSGPNQVRDILIAETAIKMQANLVSGDRNHRQVCVEYGGKAADQQDLCLQAANPEPSGS